MANEEKEKEDKIVMSFLTSLQIKRREIVKIRRGRWIECLRCGRKGTISFAYIGRKGKRAYVYCVHSERDKCYLGRAEDFLGLLVKIREGEKNEGKEQQELEDLKEENLKKEKEKEKKEENLKNERKEGNSP